MGGESWERAAEGQRFVFEGQHCAYLTVATDTVFVCMAALC